MKMRWGDVCTLEYGRALRNCAQEPSDVECYQVYGTNGPIGWTQEPLSKEAGIIIGRKGAYRGVHYSPAPFFVIDTAYYIRLKKPRIDLKWAYYNLLTVDINRIDVGAAIPTTNRDSFYAVPVTIPSFYVQKRIASVLSAYDDLIENNLRRIKLLEDSARLLYNEWFVRLRFPGYEHTRTVAGVPEGWQRKRIKDVGKVVTGKTPSTKNPDNYGSEVLFVKTPDMRGNVYVIKAETLLSEKGAQSQEEKFVPAESILVSCIGTVGIVSLTSERCQFNQQINAVMPHQREYRYYLYFALAALKEQMKAIGGGVTMDNVNKTKFENLELVCPAHGLISSFNDYCAPMFLQILNLALQNEKLRGARDILLPKLMSGKIEIHHPKE